MKETFSGVSTALPLITHRAHDDHLANGIADAALFVAATNARKEAAVSRTS